MLSLLPRAASPRDTCAALQGPNHSPEVNLRQLTHRQNSVKDVIAPIPRHGDLDEQHCSLGQARWEGRLGHRWRQSGLKSSSLFLIVISQQSKCTSSPSNGC